MASSKIRTRGSAVTAFAISSRCRCSSERSPASASGSIPSTPRLSRTLTACRRSRRGRRRRPVEASVPGEDEVLCDRQVGDERKFLEDRAHPGPLCIDRPPEPELLAQTARSGRCLARLRPRQDLDQGRLSSAVFPEQAVHLAGGGPEVGTRRERRSPRSASLPPQRPESERTPSARARGEIADSRLSRSVEMFSTCTGQITAAGRTIDRRTRIASGWSSRKRNSVAPLSRRPWS